MSITKIFTLMLILSIALTYVVVTLLGRMDARIEVKSNCAKTELVYFDNNNMPKPVYNCIGVKAGDV
tara:strand:- start:314 stop:514 length:201 start_codon:yes stop_codon:yes gene_type:complete